MTTDGERLRDLERAALAESPAVVRWIQEIRRREAFPVSLEGLIDVHRVLAAEAAGTEDIYDRAGMATEATSMPSACVWLLCQARPTRMYVSGPWAILSCDGHKRHVESAMSRADVRRQRSSSGWTMSLLPGT